MIVPLNFALLENFDTPINVSLECINGSGTVNISTEEGKFVYTSSDNETHHNSFDLDIERNISPISQVDVNFNNFTENVNSLVSTCDQIAQQYGDFSAYFKLYAACNAEHEVCKNQLNDKSLKVSELESAKANYDNCQTTLNNANTELNKYTSDIIPKLQANISSLATQTSSSKKGGVLWFGAGIIVMVVFGIIQEKKRNPRTQKDRVTGLGGGTLR